MRDEGRKELAEAYDGTKEDPYRFASSPYETEKYDSIISAAGALYKEGLHENCLEIGCANGVLSGRLSEISQRVLSLDAHEEPLVEARERNAGKNNIIFNRAEVPQMFPRGAAPFDLIVVSDVMYYLTGKELINLGVQLEQYLATGGILIVVNYSPGSCDDGRVYHVFFEYWTSLEKVLTDDGEGFDGDQRHAYLLTAYTKRS